MTSPAKRPSPRKLVTTLRALGALPDWLKIAVVALVVVVVAGMTLAPEVTQRVLSNLGIVVDWLSQASDPTQPIE